MRAVLQGKVEMREVKVKKEELLDVIRTNRTKHISEHKEAVEDYKKVAIEKINNAMEDLKSRVAELSGGEIILLQTVNFNLRVPEDHTKDYDQVIKMLEMSIDSELSIKSDEFACYVMDDWEWKNDFQHLNSTYARMSGKR